MYNLREQIENLYHLPKEELVSDNKNLWIFENFINMLDEGKIRAAEKIDNDWIVNEWVKKGILSGFRLGKLTNMSVGGFTFFDKSTYPVKNLSIERSLRIVPGGTSIRKGAYINDEVVIMPPTYVNVGGYVDSGTMLDSHSLVGSCAQIGKNCHISAAAQIGGVLEPTNARPVIIEDNVFVGGNTGIYEGTLVKCGSVIAAGVTITASTKVFDLVNETEITSTDEHGIVIPENAVVVAGSRLAQGNLARIYGLSIYSPIIIKYKDEKIKAKLALEEALRFS